MRRRYPTDRRGAALVVALVTLAIVGGVAASMLRTAVLAREEIQMAQRHRQTQWLLHSGMQRAEARMQEDEYRGETWQPELIDTAAGKSATVVIRVEEVPDEENRRRVVVVARHESAGKVVQRTQQRLVRITAKEAQP